MDILVLKLQLETSLGGQEALVEALQQAIDDIKDRYVNGQFDGTAEGSWSIVETTAK